MRNFVREHLDTYAEKDDGSEKEFWVSFFNLAVRVAGGLNVFFWALWMATFSALQ